MQDSSTSTWTIIIISILLLLLALGVYFFAARSQETRYAEAMSAEAVMEAHFEEASRQQKQEALLSVYEVRIQELEKTIEELRRERSGR